MKERPIPFSGPMVEAIFAGKKTQTRRIVKEQVLQVPPGMSEEDFDLSARLKWLVKCRCPYGQPGDRLWVRETWGLYERIHWADLGWEDQGLANFKIKDALTLVRSSGVSRALTGQSHSLVYAADGYERVDGEGGWKSSRYMPRWASRLTLEITGGRVERLNQISSLDVASEGTPGMICGRYQCKRCNGRGRNVTYPVSCPDCDGSGVTPSAYYRELWDSINGKTNPWSSNPWVWVVEFKQVTE